MRIVLLTTRVQFQQDELYLHTQPSGRAKVINVAGVYDTDGLGH